MLQAEHSIRLIVAGPSGGFADVQYVANVKYLPYETMMWDVLCVYMHFDLFYLLVDLTCYN